jgi:CheY-like chemotaxis protein
VPLIDQPIEILLVEDSVSDAKLFERWLSASALVKTIHLVHDGEMALSFLRGDGQFADVSRPDLVLLDVNLPRMSGLEVLAEVKSDPYLAKIPIVMLTSSVFETDHQQADDLRVDLFLPKPADADEFNALVESLETFWRDRSK